VASPSPTAPASALLARRELGWLVNSFRRHLDTTPLAYLRGVRMECARRDLQGAEPGDGVSVATLAAKWGFTHLGRFAVDYRRRFGTYPSQMLRS
jgi:AraC-like DNA-binding protein